MTKNVGGIDKILRFILGIAAVLLGLFAPIASGIRIIAFVVAAVALFTAIFGF
jgi:Protein of unknown function (DUF2892)